MRLGYADVFLKDITEYGNIHTFREIANFYRCRIIETYFIKYKDICLNLATENSDIRMIRLIYYYFPTLDFGVFSLSCIIPVIWQ